MAEEAGRVPVCLLTICSPPVIMDLRGPHQEAQTPASSSLPLAPTGVTSFPALDFSVLTTSRKSSFRAQPDPQKPSWAPLLTPQHVPAPGRTICVSVCLRTLLPGMQGPQEQRAGGLSGASIWHTVGARYLLTGRSEGMRA